MWQQVLCSVLEGSQQQQYAQRGDEVPGTLGPDTDDDDQPRRQGGGSGANHGNSSGRSSGTGSGKRSPVGRLRLVCKAFRDAVDGTVRVLQVMTAPGCRRAAAAPELPAHWQGRHLPMQPSAALTFTCGLG